MIKLVQFFIIALLSLCLPACAEQGRASTHTVDESDVHFIQLAPPLNRPDAEISGMAWCQGDLILLPQYPEFTEPFWDTNPEKYFYRLKKSQIDAYLSQPDHAPLMAEAIPLNEQGIRDQLAHFDGYEAIACEGEQMWLSIEMDGQKRQFQSHLVKAHYEIEGVSPSISVQPETLKRVDAPTSIVNIGREALLLSDDKLLSFYELNSERITPQSKVHWHSLHSNKNGELPLTQVPFRLTDASALDQQNRFWAINYLWQGDKRFFEAHDPIVPRGSQGHTHHQFPQVERLLEFELNESGVQLTQTPPIQLKLSNRDGRNWEGIARLDQRGLLIVTDKHPTTLFAFVAFPDVPAAAEKEDRNGAANTVRVASFNVSMEANNYQPNASSAAKSVALKTALENGSNKQIRHIAEIIQHVRPDVVLLNEFDYIENWQYGARAFVRHYLNKPQKNEAAIDYPFIYVAPVNTGVASPFDLDNDGHRTGTKGDAWGYGEYSGHYGMVLLSRFPIDHDHVRTFQHFLWKDMPEALVPTKQNGKTWYSTQEWQQMRLSSKSHWDIPVLTPAGVLHVLAAHPTPPTFDGAEDRNGKRNHDEIRFWYDYINNQNYIYDDQGRFGGLNRGTKYNPRFVIVGDLNASPDQGEAILNGIQSLLSDPQINTDCVPSSKGAQAARVNDPAAAYHTAAWGLRVDYVLASKTGQSVDDCGVFWPDHRSSYQRLVKDRATSSDHRLVWVDLELYSANNKQ